MISAPDPPFFSIVVPLYNKRQYVEECITSVLLQTFNDFELLIIDDGSTDGSLEIAKRFSDTRISIVLQSNQGVSVARNTGIYHASAKYIAFLDADDFWSPHFLEAAHADISQNLSILFWSCGYQFVMGNSSRVARFGKSPIGGPGPLANYFDCSLVDPIVTSSSVIMKKSLLKKIDGFPVGETIGEDLATWARAASYTPLFFQPKILSNYRSEGGNNHSRLQPAPRRRLLVLDELENRFAQGDTSGLRYYILYSGKSSYRQARSGRSIFALQIVTRSLLLAVRHRRPLLGLLALSYAVRLIVLILELELKNSAFNINRL